MAAIQLGPLLGYEGLVDGRDIYTICFLSNGNVEEPELKTTAGSLPFDLLCETPTGLFWRVELDVKPEDQGYYVDYWIKAGDANLGNTFVDEWRFYITGTNEEPRLAYATCNGFGSKKSAKETIDHDLMWRRLAQEHDDAPFSMMLMGGDQLYGDGVWRHLPPIWEWEKLPEAKKSQYVADKVFEETVNQFYEMQYIKRWRYESVAKMMSSTPVLMMWDDHDIFDGWGSFPEHLAAMPLYRKTYEAARRFFELFQIRSKNNRTLLNPDHDYSFAVRYRNYEILALDQRSHRTMDQIMDETQWNTLMDWAQTRESCNLIVMCAVPVLYRSFSFVEKLHFITSRIKMDDDIRDHWSANRHLDERKRFVGWLMDLADRVKGKVVITSGDVHVAGMGIIRQKSRGLKIMQVISSAIMNHPPKWWQWQMIKMMSHDDTIDYKDMGVKAKMIHPEDGTEILRTRNYAVFAIENDILMVRWRCEDGRNPWHAF